MLNSVTKSVSEGKQTEPKTMLLYGAPCLLNSSLHKDLTLRFDAADHGFAAHSNSFLIAAPEIEQAAADYPVVFVGQPNTGYTLAAIVGLHDGVNLMVDLQGHWLRGTYVPAFVRRYPFVMLEEESGQMSVGFDQDCAGFADPLGERLFDADGSPSKLLKHAIGFLDAFHQQMQLTLRFTQRLQELGLLVQRVIEVSSGPSRSPRVLQGFSAVDAQRLAALPADTLKELAQGPELGWIYAHLQSLARVDRLAARVDRTRHEAMQTLPHVDVSLSSGVQRTAQAATESPIPEPAQTNSASVKGKKPKPKRATANA